MHYTPRTTPRAPCTGLAAPRAPVFLLLPLPAPPLSIHRFRSRFDDIPDITARGETGARFRKAEQWGLRAWNDEYFALMDFPPHVLKVTRVGPLLLVLAYTSYFCALSSTSSLKAPETCYSLN